jgi:hypothetical protein
VGYAIKAACHLLLLGRFHTIINISRLFFNGTFAAYMYIVNRRRDRLYGPPNKADSDEAGMQDKTEFENKHFRYVL